MTVLVDNAIALRILYLLVLPFNKWKAYSEGVIDDEGTVLDNEADSENWTMLHRLVSRLKKLLGKLPMGKTQLASIVAAYSLVKETYDQKYEPSDDSLEIMFTDLQEAFLSDKFKQEDLESNIRDFYDVLFEEEGPTNSVENVAGIKPGEEPPGKKKKKVTKLIKRAENI